MTRQQTREFSVKYYFALAREGFSIVVQELGRLIRSSRHSSPSDEQQQQQQNEPEDAQPTTVIYCVHVFARLSAITSLWIPAHVLDIRHGLSLSRPFVLFSYLVCVVGFMVGKLLADFVLEPIMSIVLVGAAKSIYGLISLMFTLMQLAYIFYGIFCLAYLIRQSDFIRDFWFYQAASLRLPKRFQRQTVCYVVFTSSLLILGSEPLFVAISLFQDIEQPRMWPSLSPGLFSAAKLGLILLITYLTVLVSSLANMITLASRVLILSIAKHLEITFSKQLARLHGPGLRHHLGGHNQQLVALVDDVTSAVSTDYSCDTLTMDWPHIYDHHLSDDDTVQIEQVSSESRSAATGSSLLFVYRSLLKSLNELHQLIDAYESRFALFHLASICLNGLFVAQWVVSSLTQARLIANREAKGDQLARSQTLLIINGFHLTPYAIRTAISVVIFFVSNVHLFLSCDSLPSRVAKIQSHLFKLNVHLTGQLADGTTHGGHTRPPELGQAWSLYDELVRMGARANFQLSPSTYYNKKVLITIFGREISLILLYVQIIDIYTYV